MSDALIKRHFLGWNQHFLHLVASWLSEDAENPFWLQDYVCALPGKRASRRLNEILTMRAAEHGTALVPPEYLSIGLLPEYIAGEKGHYLSNREVEFIWEEVLLEGEEQDFGWLTGVKDIRTAARQLTALWEKLGQAGYTFSGAAEIIQQRMAELTFYEERWEQLVALEHLFAQKILDYGLLERSLQRQSALLKSFASDGKKLVIIGALDLSLVHQTFLQRAPCETHLLIPLPEQHAGGVNEAGALIPEYWTDVHAQEGLVEGAMRSVADCESEAAITVDVLQEALSNGIHPQDITVSFADEQHEPLVRQSLEAYNISHHTFARCGGEYRSLSLWFKAASLFLENPLAQTAVTLLKSKWSAYLLLEENTTESFLHLERIITERCLSRIFPLNSNQFPGDVSADMDELRHVDVFLEVFSEEMSPQYFIETLEKHVMATLQHHIAEQGVFSEVLMGLESEFERQLRLVRRPEEYFSYLADLALRLGAGQEPAAQGPRDSEIELVGWLETLFDDAEHLLVLGCHDKVLPAGEREGAWLPEALQGLLKMETKERQFVRDYVYALHAQHSKQRVTFIFPKMSINGDYYRPSRLFFGGALETKLCNAKKSLVEVPEHARLMSYGEGFGDTGGWFLENFMQIETREVEAMSVTSFRDYLLCPFRFYLKHILRLRAFDPIQEELSAMQFGTLFHNIVANFGNSSVKDSSNQEEILDFLLIELERVRHKALGSAIKPAVEVQCLQLEERLTGFARVQAAWRRDGWQIVHVELPFYEKKVGLQTSAGAMGLRGQIDRIDFHPELKKWVALDYKTSMNPFAPEKTHQIDEEWCDLQLPLYEFAMRALKFKGDIELGYFVLPANVSKSAVLIASWSESQLKEAQGAAQQVAQNVIRGEFWPPNILESRFDDFSELIEPDQHSALLEYSDGREEGS